MAEPYTSWALVDARVRKSEREILGNERRKKKKNEKAKATRTNKQMRAVTSRWQSQPAYDADWHFSGEGRRVPEQSLVYNPGVSAD